MKKVQSTVVTTVKQAAEMANVPYWDRRRPLAELAEKIVIGVRDGLASYDDLRLAMALVRQARTDDETNAAFVSEGRVDAKPGNHEALAKQILEGVQKLIREQGTPRTVGETVREGVQRAMNVDDLPYIRRGF